MKKQIIALLGIGTLAYLSAKPLLMETRASLTAPTGYEIGYLYYDNPSPAPDFWALNFPGNTSYQDPGYTRTADGAYYNYTHIFSKANYSALPYGLTITNTFNRSNTLWTATGTGLFYPTDNKIGSDATVGTLANKVYLNVDNQTNKNYTLYFDISSTTSFRYYKHVINNVDTYGLGQGFALDNTLLNRFYLPAYSTLTIYSISSASSMYFDAWYLDDLGVSSAYNNGYTQGDYDGYQDGYEDGAEFNQNAGYDQGYDDGYLDGIDSAESNVLSRMSLVLRSVFNGLTNILTIPIFDQLTIGTIMLFPFAFVIVSFIFRLIRGGRS